MTQISTGDIGTGPHDAPVPRPLTRGRIAAILVVGITALGILLSLGAWQVERLFWKEGLIATIDARIHAPPVDVSDVARRVVAGEDIDYVPVTARGRFLHAGERFFLATREGAAGWHVLTPLLLADGAVVFVNRGFVPYERKDSATRQDGNPADEVRVTGLARAAPTEKPNMFVPDNDPAKNAFFWRSVPDMAQGLDLPTGSRLLPFLIDAGPGQMAAGAPIGGTTVIDIPNSHLEYAITWFSLAAALLVILVLFLMHLWRRGRAIGQG
ncbi:SURF1 family protein [Aureimonas phyllosphaerae]|uniref:SURF1-like protein n=1 Tax=Aureimonas phyllosphaerae TaxID=1166078 RepID=A0A7W6FTG7_9HYPH|nr:SURF1 family protein [Aureimonas phyllosphaerae]MBB3935028.1 surfeit locus 1 family protein [Aureimonas phyllosphaerae]MBB3959036.1 surfeit locus 1 family protein [Aureimonas phyllosphaerae]SFF08805.1 surfeit locus 1 family protein [Aureimonas phyllosphaerae]